MSPEVNLPLFVSYHLHTTVRAATELLLSVFMTTSHYTPCRR